MGPLYTVRLVTFQPRTPERQTDAVPHNIGQLRPHGYDRTLRVKRITFPVKRHHNKHPVEIYDNIFQIPLTVHTVGKIRRDGFSYGTHRIMASVYALHMSTSSAMRLAITG